MNDIWISQWSYDSVEQEKKGNNEIAVPKRGVQRQFYMTFALLLPYRILTVVHVHLHFEASHMVSIEYIHHLKHTAEINWTKIRTDPMQTLIKRLVDSNYSYVVRMST